MAIPTRERALQSGDGPVEGLTDTQRDAGRPADPRPAVHDDPLNGGASLDKPNDLGGLFGSEEDIVWTRVALDVIERETENRDESRGDLRGGRRRITDRNTGLDSARLVALGVRPGKHVELDRMTHRDDRIIS
jgi:hypothetical protein